VNPYDFDRLGVANGDQVRVHSPRAEVTAEITADDGVPRGSASLRFNQPGLDAAALLDLPVRSLSLGQRMRCELVASMLHLRAATVNDQGSGEVGTLCHRLSRMDGVPPT